MISLKNLKKMKINGPKQLTGIFRQRMIPTVLSLFIYCGLVQAQPAKKTLMNTDNTVVDTITASSGCNVKLVYKGDTIVYRADAFYLQEGSMVNDLIKQLPRVLLKDNGELYVDGRKVDYLRLNGKDFFKGNNQALLENIPFYTVKNIQVYERTTDKSSYLEYNTEKKDYVLDVNLKREYSQGYMANIEASEGTKDRYSARGFGLRFTENSRFSIFSNLNNINEYRKPGSDVDWTPSNAPQGRCDTKKVGMDLFIDDKDQRFTEKAYSQLSWKDDDYQQREAFDNYIAAVSPYTYKESASRSKNLSFNMTNDFMLKKPIWIRSLTYVSYDHSKNSPWSRGAILNSNLDYLGGTHEALDSIYKKVLTPTLRSMIASRNRTITKDNSDNLYANEQFNISKRLPWGDDLDLSCDLSYQNSNTKNYRQYRADFLQAGYPSSFSNQYTNSSCSGYSYSPKIEYTMRTSSKWYFLFYALYNQKYESKENDLYHLDRIDGWGLGSEHSLGDLPSTRDSLLLGMDASEADNSTYLARTTEGGLRIFLDKKTKDGYIWFNLHLPLQRYIERTRFVRKTIDSCVYLRNWVFKPDMTLYVYTHNYNRMFYFNYNTDFGTPSIYQMLNVLDTTDPYAMRIGNPNLKNWVNYNLDFRYSDKKQETQQSFSINGAVNIYTNRVGYKLTNNHATGVATYHPENVNGNWHCSLDGTFGRAIDEQKFWMWETRLSWNYYRSVDYITQSGMRESELSKVNNSELEDVLRLRYQRDKLTISGQCDVTWRNSSSHRQGFTTIDAYDYNYGISGEYTFPWNIQFATDLKMYSRRGYDNSSMNTNHLIWNASLSRAFCKSRLIAKIVGFDLLHKMSQTTSFVNAMGKTETWVNSIPSYVMLNLCYRINVLPNKK